MYHRLVHLLNYIAFARHRCDALFGGIPVACGIQYCLASHNGMDFTGSIRKIPAVRYIYVFTDTQSGFYYGQFSEHYNINNYSYAERSRAFGRLAWDHWPPRFPQGLKLGAMIVVIRPTAEASSDVRMILCVSLTTTHRQRRRINANLIQAGCVL